MNQNQYKHVRIGGLLRCCVATIEDHNFTTAPKEGDILECKYCTDTMVYHNECWEWNRPVTQLVKN